MSDPSTLIALQACLERVGEKNRLEELERQVAGGKCGEASLRLMERLYGDEIDAPGLERLQRYVASAGKKGAGRALEAEQRVALQVIGEEKQRLRNTQRLWELTNSVGPGDDPGRALIPDTFGWQMAHQVLERLDRAIDRKVRIIMELAKRADARQHEPPDGGSREAEADDAPRPRSVSDNVPRPRFVSDTAPRPLGGEGGELREPGEGGDHVAAGFSPAFQIDRVSAGRRRGRRRYSSSSSACPPEGGLYVPSEAAGEGDHEAAGEDATNSALPESDPELEAVPPANENLTERSLDVAENTQPRLAGNGESVGRGPRSSARRHGNAMPRARLKGAS